MSRHNKITDTEKKRILEMYNGKNSQYSQLDEQKIFSGVKSGIKGFGTKIKTGLKNMIYGLKGDRGKIKNPNLQRDVAKMQSRASDLISTMIPFIESINQVKTVIQTYPEVYGKEYVQDANHVATEIQQLEEYMGKMRRVLEEFKQNGQVEDESNTDNLEANKDINPNE